MQIARDFPEGMLFGAWFDGLLFFGGSLVWLAN